MLAEAGAGKEHLTIGGAKEPPVFSKPVRFNPSRLRRVFSFGLQLFTTIGMNQPPREKIEFRAAAPEDAAAIRALTREAYAKWVPAIGREPLPMSTDYEQAIPTHRFDLLFVEARLVGLIETAQQEGGLLIVNVAVAPSRQGRGYGGRLLRHAEALASSLGVREIRLYTNEKFAANVALYHRFGYRVDREEPFMGGTTVHMSKRLPNGTHS
jgi:ribosomal protein S18 acetylase RimI-like enzyme